MAKESRLGDRLVVVGDSAITIYTNAECVSAGFDVGGKTRIIPVSGAVFFDGRYWRRDNLGLAVEPGQTRYFGLRSRTVRFVMKVGAVRLAASEDLIVCRLVYAKGEFGERNRRALAEAIHLSLRFEGSLDREYLEKEVRYETVADPHAEMIRRSRRQRKGPGGRARS